MQTLTIGAYRATLKPTRNVGEFTAKLAKCNGKSRRLPLRDLRTKARFPVFEPGMSTAEYVRLYSSGDGSLLKAWEWAQLNDAPCTLYSGEDTCETLPDGFETWEDFDAAQGSSAAAESAPADAELIDAAEPVAPDDAIAPAIVAGAELDAPAPSARAEPYPGCEPAAAIVYRVHLATHSQTAPVADPLATHSALIAEINAMSPVDAFDYLADYTAASERRMTDAEKAPDAMRAAVLADVERTGEAIFWARRRGEPDDDGPPASPPATHSEPAPARPVYANDHLAWADVERDRSDPDEYQARLIECFGEVKAGGLFYNSDTYPATAALMTARYGYPDWRGDRGQSDGVANFFGMDCYRADSVIRARAERERERDAAATFTVGQRFARLIFNDGKQRAAAELVTLDPSGFACKLKAKSGRNSVEITCSAYALSMAVIRAEERGKVLAAKRARARPEPIAPMPAEPAPVPGKSEPERVMPQHVLGALPRIAPDGIPDAAMLVREADRIEATAERMRDAMPDYSATCATVARDLRALADSAIDPLPGKSDPEALDDDETIPAPLDGLDVAELDDMVEFERAGGIAQPIAPAYRDDAPRATPTPSLRISPSDPRARIPARFAPVYLLQA